MNRQPKTVNKETSPQKPAPPPQPPARPSFYLNPQQLATMQYMQNQQQSLSPAQRQLLLHLQQQYRLMQQHQQVTRLQQQQSMQQGQQASSSTSNTENQATALSIGAIPKRKPVIPKKILANCVLHLQSLVSGSWRQCRVQTNCQNFGEAICSLQE